MNELVCTAMLLLLIHMCLTVGGAANPPLAIGLGLTAIVYAGFPISGAHLNPSVTLTLFLRGKIAAHDTIMYWAFQLLGGYIGSLLGHLIGGKGVRPALGEGYNLVQAFLAELIFTSMLCFVVLAVATSSKAEKNEYYALAIGAIVFAGASCAGPISGAAFNPAVVFGLCAVKDFYKLLTVGYSLWIIIAEIAGAVLGAFLFYVVAPDEFEVYGGNVGELRGELTSLINRDGADGREGAVAIS